MPTAPGSLAGDRPVSERGGVPARERRRRLGQNFLADPNLLDAIVRESGLVGGEVVLEVGGGEGALTERLAEVAGTLHVIEIDQRLRGALEAVSEAHPNVTVHWADAVRADLAALDPTPGALVSNLPYKVATPVLMRTIAELPSVRSWTVMVQREIADRLRARPGTREYGAVSVIAQLACEVEMLRSVDRAVFVPRPRVDSALLRLSRRNDGPAAGGWTRQVVRAAFAHRRKGLARSLELALPAEADIRSRAREALAGLGADPGSRAQELDPGQLAALAEAMRSDDG